MGGTGHCGPLWARFLLHNHWTEFHQTCGNTFLGGGLKPIRFWWFWPKDRSHQSVVKWILGRMYHLGGEIRIHREYCLLVFTRRLIVLTIEKRALNFHYSTLSQIPHKNHLIISLSYTVMNESHNFWYRQWLRQTQFILRSIGQTHNKVWSEENREYRE